MIISIASGKGGTGKTTVAVNLAFSMESDVQFLDCDVEEPNAHLFIHPEMKDSQTVFTPIPEIDIDKCTYCRKCTQICRFRAIAVFKNTVLTFPELCHSCGGCWAVCPESAVSESGRELGTIDKGKQGHIHFIHGRLRIGEAMSPPLIRSVRSFAHSDRINIIDAPPGTSCPVIGAMKNTDFVLLVTEPTPFGLHDLKLAVEAVKRLDIPRGLVINRSDLGDDRVKQYADRENLPILMEIPFDRKIAEAYSKGQVMVNMMPEWKIKFNDMLKKIKDLAA